MRRHIFPWDPGQSCPTEVSWKDLLDLRIYNPVSSGLDWSSINVMRAKQKIKIIKKEKIKGKKCIWQAEKNPNANLFTVDMLHKAQLCYLYAENIISLEECEKTKTKEQQTGNTRLACKTGAKHLTIKESPRSVQQHSKQNGFH